MTPSLRQTLSKPALILAAIVALAAWLRYWGLGFGLPYTQARPDEAFVIDVALKFLKGDIRPRFFDYPWFLMYLVTALYLMYGAVGWVAGTCGSVADLVASWSIRWEPFFLINRGLSAACGTISVVLLYRLGRELFDVRTGLVSAFFLAVAFLHVRDSHFGTTDVALTCFALLSTLWLVRAHGSRKPGHFALAGVCGGLAAGTKYNGVLLAAPFVTSYLLHVYEARGNHGRAMLDRRLVLGGVPFAAALLACTPFVFLDFEEFRKAMVLLQQAIERGQNPALELGSGGVWHLTMSLRHGLGLPLLACGLAGLPVMLARDWKKTALLFTFPLAYYIVAAESRLIFVRYMVPVVPFLCLSAAVLAVEAGRRLTVTRLARVREAVTVALAVGVAIPSVSSAIRFDRLISATDNRVITARWVEQHVPPGSSILQSGSSFGHVQLDRRLGYRRWLWDRDRLAFMLDGQRATGRPDWILLQESPLPSRTQPIVRQFLKEDYVLVERFRALVVSEAGNIFDPQDAFFVPYAGFRKVWRPGPNFHIYRRASRAGAAARDVTGTRIGPA